MVKRFTRNDEKIVAWTFRPSEYLLSEREPATSNFQYIPAMGLYEINEGKYSPIFGVTYNTVMELKRNKPPMLLIDQWSNGSLFEQGNTWQGYTKDIMEYVNENYYKFLEKPYYISKAKVEQLRNNDRDLFLKLPKLELFNDEVR